MAHQQPRLPESFLRGLEADLRALCTDARRKNPQVKDAAERVILALKQADTPELKLDAANIAAAAFCTACESPPNSSSSSSSSSLSSYIKVVLRAVTSLHKLLTHRAISSARIPEVLDALHRLALSAVDDTITLKVLQGLLSLLTVRTYAKALSEDDLSRAFSLLFVLRSVHSSSGNPASNAITSAISQMSSAQHQQNQGMLHQHDLGVIEQTSKAAFRQASSDLFASAADAAVQTAVRMQVPSGEFIPLDDFPTEARASYRFFMDLCNSVMGEPLSWLSKLSISKSKNSGASSQPLGLDLSLALEVVDDGLSSSVGLFAAQPVFLDVLSKKLCPVIHKLFTSTTLIDKGVLKSLFALVVTVVTHYWRNLPTESQDLLHALVNICKQHLHNTKPSDDESGSGIAASWRSVYAMEAMRCIVRAQMTEGNAVMDFVLEFELSNWSTKPLSAVIAVASEAMNPLLLSSASHKPTVQLPIAPITGALKPFAKTIANTTAFLAATATGLYVHIITGANLAAQLKSEAKDKDVVSKALLDNKYTAKAIGFIGEALELHAFVDSPTSMSRFVTTSINGADDVVELLAEAISQVCIISDICHMDNVRMQTFSNLAAVCCTTAKGGSGVEEMESTFEKRVTSLYGVLFNVVDRCQESLGRSWSAAIDAFDVLDALISQQLQQQKQHQVTTTGGGSLTAGEKKGFGGLGAGATLVMKQTTAQELKERLDGVFLSAGKLQWAACHDMISALVQCSRQSMASVSRRGTAAGAVEEVNLKSAVVTGVVDATKATLMSNMRVFGISAAEMAMLSALRRTEVRKTLEKRKDGDVDVVGSQGTDVDPMPSTLWELLAGHLTSVCSDSPLYALRLYALNSLTRIACQAIVAGECGVTVAHEKIITPFLDLFNSSHSDVRSGSLSSVYAILETQGERLEGETAWRVVLSILTTAAGRKANAKAKDGLKATSNMNNSSNVLGAADEMKMISEGFKVVQVIADDFLSSLARNSLPSWLDVLGLYCRQEDDINVALTSIGLLWRTADFLAKKHGREAERDGVEEVDAEVDGEAKMEDWLWVEVFTILKEVSTDERPEIRNCAVKTLTGALTAHSVRLSAHAWSGCVSRALLPLLEDVMKGGVVVTATATTSSSSTSLSSSTSAADVNAANVDSEKIGMSNTKTSSSADPGSNFTDDTSNISRSVTATRSAANAGASSGSGSGRNDAQVMWHHSRDTPRKQWNETRVLALGGVAKVLRSAMPRLAELLDENGRPLFLTLTDGGKNGLWRKMLRAAGVAAASRDGEVAVAGVSALLEMLAAAGLVVRRKPDEEANKPDGEGELGSSVSAPAVMESGTVESSGGVVASMSWIMGGVGSEVKKEPNENITVNLGVVEDHEYDGMMRGTVMLWEAVWSALVEAICGPDGETETGSTVSTPSPSRIVDQKALEMLAVGLIESRTKLGDKFTRGSSRMLVQVLLYLARGSKNEKNNRDRVSEVQEVTLRGLTALSLGGDDESWAGLLRGLLKLVSDSGTFEGVREIVVCRRVLGIVRSGYEGTEMGETVKKGMLTEVIQVMGKIMMIGRGVESERRSRLEGMRFGTDGKPRGTDGEGEEGKLWKEGCDVLIAAMKHGSEAVDMSQEWNVCSSVIEEFLFGQDSLASAMRESSRESSSEREVYDMKLIGCVSEGVGRMRVVGKNEDDGGTLERMVEQETKRKLVNIVWKGAEEGEEHRRRKFVRMCQMTLFSLSHGGVQMDQAVVDECGSRVVDMCGRVLGKYIADGTRGGRCPLPAARRAEAVFLLRQLRAMAVVAHHRATAVDGNVSGFEEVARKRIVALYPRLCECVESRDEAIRLLARELLDDTYPSLPLPQLTAT